MVNKILVTGGKGFIGSHLIDKLIESEYETYSFDNSQPGFGNHILPKECHEINGDIRNFDHINFATKNIDMVVHLAALSHISTCLNDPKLAFNINVNGTINLLEACKKNNIKRIVIAASDHIYGKNPAIVPVAENDGYKALYESDVYGKTKAMQAIIGKMYYDLYNLPVVMTASGNVYSERQSKPNMVPNFIDAAIKNEDIIIHGDGEQTRDVYHISDLIDGYIKCLETPRIKGELFNFGSGQEISVNKIAQLIIDLTNSKSKIIHVKETKFNAMNRMSLVIHKAKILLNWAPKISLENGLKRTIEEWRLKI